MEDVARICDEVGFNYRGKEKILETFVEMKSSKGEHQITP